MEAGRAKAKEEMTAAVEQERERSKVSLTPNTCIVKIFIIHTLQELLSEAVQEERGRSEAAVQRAVESTREQVQGRMNDESKVGVVSHMPVT